jgi:Uma2 family endonuclease
VVSPDSGTTDYRFKRSEYAALEVPEYWIVDPFTCQVTVLEFVEGLYEEAVFSGEERIASVQFPELNLTVEQVLASGNLAH